MRVIQSLLSLLSLISVLAPSTVEAQGVDRVFWIREAFVPAQATIEGINFDGSNPTSFYASSEGAGIDIDWTNQKIYWSARSSIKRSDLDGSNIETVVPGLLYAIAIALDVESEKIYWVSSYDNTVRRADFNGGGMEVLYTTAGSLVGIALDLPRGRLYASEPTSNRLLRMNLNGSDLTVIPIAANSPNGIAVDSDSQRIYVAATDSDSIVSCDLDGLNQTSFPTIADEPVDVDIDPIAGKVYWLRFSGGIYRANIDGSNQELFTNDATAVGRALRLDIDRDGDGVRNSLDTCPTDPNKSVAGVCGCGLPETDSDGDGTPNCVDLCPSDSGKTAAGVCGCGISDLDSDGDGTLNCNDTCASDSAKTAPGICGCGITEVDANGNSITDCLPEEALQSKAALLRGQVDTFAFKSAAKKRKDLKTALSDFEKAFSAFPAAGTDVAKDAIRTRANSATTNVNELIKVQAKGRSKTAFSRAQRQSRLSLASLSELLSAAR